MASPAVAMVILTVANGVREIVQSQQTAKQAEYDAEYNAELLKQEAERERLEREQASKIQARKSEEAKRRRLAYFTKAGGGLNVSQMMELQRQAKYDELDTVNAGLQSYSRRRKLSASSRNALTSGRYKAGAYRSQGYAIGISSLGSAVGVYSKYG